MLFKDFLENLDKKNCVFSARAFTSKLVNNGSKGAFKKILRFLSQKSKSQNSTKVQRGDFLDRQGVESQKEESDCPPPLNPTRVD